MNRRKIARGNPDAIVLLEELPDFMHGRGLDQKDKGILVRNHPIGQAGRKEYQAEIMGLIGGPTELDQVESGLFVFTVGQAV